MLLALAVLGVGVASAAPTYNLEGQWTTGYREGNTATRQPANGSYDITAMNMSTGVFSGSAVVTGTSFAVKGEESGAAVKQTLTLGSYVAYDEYTVSALGSGHIGTNDGTFNATAFGQPPTNFFWAELTGSTTAGEEAAKKAKEEAEKEKRPTGTSITCNYEFATSENTCVAVVGDGGAPPSIVPTGTVTFTTTTGGFSSGASCSIAQQPSAPSTSTCSLVYFTMESGLPSITASYGGDAHHAPSSGKTQYLGLGTEGTYEAPTGPSGQYPNEVGVSTEVPASGTTVEGSVQGGESTLLPVPVTLPAVQPSLDPTSAADLRTVEALVGAVDVEGGQNPAKLAELNASAEKLEARSVEVSKGSSPADVAEAQALLKDSTEAVQSITAMVKLEDEYLKDALNGTRLAGQADKKIETLDAHAVEQLKSASPAEQAKGQAELNEANKELEALLKASKQRGEVLKKVINNLGTAFIARAPAAIKAGRVKPIGHVVLHGAAAGKLKIKIKLNRAALNKLAGKRSSVTVYVRVQMILPSGTVKGGVPRFFEQRVTLKRAPKHKK
jgi:hypothetical protein